MPKRTFPILTPARAVVRTLRLGFFLALLLALRFSLPAQAQAALFLEEPYGVFGHLNPTGHAALYLSHVCAETPVKLRMCGPGENGVVLSRYEGIGHYDWVAIPLIPYLYSVNSVSKVPDRVNVAMVDRLRDQYRERFLGEFTEGIQRGGFFSGGWTELVGAAYERRIYALSFQTTREQDEALVRVLNERANISHFHLLTNNCSDFDRYVLNLYFPRKFRRSVFPDAGITTPRHIAHRLVVYAHRHPQLHLAFYQIPQVPGYRKPSHKNHGVAESLVKSGYMVPIVILSPYVAGGLLADYLITGRDRILPHNVPRLNAKHLAVLTDGRGAVSGSTAVQTASVAPVDAAPVNTAPVHAAASVVASVNESPAHVSPARVTPTPISSMQATPAQASSAWVEGAAGDHASLTSTLPQ